MALQGPSSSSSAFLTRPWAYDVFLSFRGEDTRKNFTANLYDALHRKGIITYIDDKLRRGEEISQALLKAIDESRISIVVLSKNYASSTWCLDELMKILECRETKQQMVLPVFYDVDSSEVRHQRESFGEALGKLEDRFKDDTRIQRWKAALTEVANFSGWHFGENGNESKFIQEIAQVVSRIVNRTHLNVAKYPVGMESRVQDMNVLLSIGMNDTRMVGIFGVGGIGKTTIAKAVYNLVAFQFEDSCFLANVRETSKRECGLVQLQKTLLSDILGNSSLKVDNIDQGINVIKKSLCDKKILLVLDDVDQLVQLDALSGDCNWFGLGSRIIITTRDKHLLAIHKVDLTYEVKQMDRSEALQLFSWNAFKIDKPNDVFEELTGHALRYAEGLPLALSVIGSDLYGRDICYWKSVLQKYKKIPEGNIQEKLKISYDGLDESEKNIFLDIACFFKEEREEYVRKILDSCGFFPDRGIQVLVDKSLITVEFDRLLMHDLLQDMGREIVRQESPKAPGERSRLWYHEDVRNVLEENMGTSKIEGILVELPERDLIRLGSKTFTKMKRLRLFINRNAHFSGQVNYLSNELRLLDWPELPLQSLPRNFHGKKLAVLKVHNSLFKEPREGFKNFQNMGIMEFSYCKFLKTIPDISSMPNLEKLNISYCESLVEVDDSVGCLDRLVYLSFSGCSNLISLPRSFKLRSLKMLYLDGCLSIQNIPEIECQMEYLESIYLQDTSIKELPSSIGYLTQLRDLHLGGCKNLMQLPSSILQLPHLETLSLENCSELVKLSKNDREKRQSILISVVSTEECEAPSASELPLLPSPTNPSLLDHGCSSTVFPELESLNLKNCVLSASDFLVILNCFSTLQSINLSGSKLVSLPTCIKRFVELKMLILESCMQLREILELPPNIEEVYASECMSLESFPEVVKKYQYNKCELRALSWIDLSGCNKMHVNIGNHVTNPSLDEESLKGLSGGIIIPGNRLPDWFNHRKESLDNDSCEINVDVPLYLEEIKGIVFCAVIGPVAANPSDWAPNIGVEIVGYGVQAVRILVDLMGSDHIWLEYVLESLDLKAGNLRVRFYTDSNSVFFKSCGVHLLHKNEVNVNDQPGRLHEDVNVEADLLDEVENPPELMDSIQFSKRFHSEDYYSSDANWYPPQKRRSSTKTSDSDGSLLSESHLSQSN